MTDFLCLPETWVKPSELHLIQDNINSHEVSKNQKYYVFNKCGMTEDDEHSTGRPFGGVAIICKHTKGLSYEEVNCDHSRIIAVLVKNVFN